MKYLIELEEETFEQNNDPIAPTGTNTLWRAKGFNTLVFDANGLRKLKEFKEPYAVFETEKEYRRYFDSIEKDAYERGLKEGYEKCLQEHEFATAGQFAREEDIYKEGWKKGVEKAWGAACRIVDCEWPERRAITGDEQHTALWDVFNSLTGEEAIQRVRDYDREGHVDLNLKVGDEVTGPTGQKYVVIGVTGMGTVAGLEFNDGTLSYRLDQINTVKRTGRSFPELIELFRKAENNGEV